MRTIQFRAWHKEAKVMLDSEKASDAIKWKEEGQPIELMQFTGLQTNGVPVFEGDTFYPKGYPRISDYKGSIVWSNERAQFMAQYNSGTRHPLVDRIDNIEIIGHIFET